MPSDGETVAARVSATKELLDQASERRASVAGLASAMVTRAKWELRIAARRGAYWRLVELLARQALAAIGTISYLFIALVGLAYSWGYYSHFDDIHIFGLFDTSDFLLSAFANWRVLLTGAFAPLALLVLLGFCFWALNIRRARLRISDRRDARLVSVATFLFLSAATGVLLLPLWIGYLDGRRATQDPDWVQVTFRAESAQWRPPGEGSTALLGTTSSFHVFLECEDADNSKKEPGNAASSAVGAASPDVETEGGEHKSAGSATEDVDACRAKDAFVVPTANIASVTFTRSPRRSRASDTEEAAEASVDAINVVVDATIEEGGLNVGYPTMMPVHTGGGMRGSPDLHDPVTTFTVLFRPLSPFTTGADGATVMGSAAEWLERFRAALSSCGIERVAVVGHASTEGFGGIEHRNVWTKVFEPPQDRRVIERSMNCGLANLRAIEVGARLVGNRDVYERLREAHRKLKEAKRMNVETGGDVDDPRLEGHADAIRDLLTGLCTGPIDAAADSTAVVVDIESWSGHDEDWSWLPGATSGPLNRSAQIALEGRNHLEACPGLLGTFVVPLRIGGTGAP